MTWVLTPAQREAACPNGDEHTPSPRGYLQWHAWAERIAKTHEQVRCPDCGLYAIWRPKKPRGQT